MRKVLFLGIVLTLLVPVCRLVAAEAPAEQREKGQQGTSEGSVDALQKYVAKPDDSFKWVKRREGELLGTKYVELTLTSQTWQGVVWKHQLFILKPPQVGDGSRAMLLIDGGRWSEELARPVEGSADEIPKQAIGLAAAAAQIKAPVAILRQVPQQPMFGGMVEDQIISYTFAQFLKTQDTTWPLLLPMVKSAVRGMDAVQEFAKQEWGLEIQSFTLTGASKRGWTTWLTAAVDPRVHALAPMVIDMLNMTPQMKHQVAAFGKYSEQLDDYTNRNLQAYMNTPAGKRLQAIVDPYSYRAALRQPKLILLGTNDRYWPVDALNLYWEGLQGEKRVLYVPNNGHGLKDLERVIGTISALHRHAAGEIRLAELQWECQEQDGQLSLGIKCDVKPESVSAWVATAETQDFRKAEWKSFPATLVDGTYRFRHPLPVGGYVALFGEAVFDHAGPRYFLSTTMKVAGAKSPPDNR